MRHSAIVGVAVLTVALVGCGEDGPDAPGAAFAAANDGSAAEIQILAAAPDDGHGEAAHDESAEAMEDDGEMTHDEAEGTHDDAEATHDDSSAAEHDGFVVDVEMVEFGFVLDTTKVPIGEPITFRFRNTGDVEHEAMFGSAHQQTEYAAADGHGDGHGGDSHHGGVAAITLAAGETGEMVLSFDEPDEIWIGCHIEGHWDAGMQMTFEIA